MEHERTLKRKYDELLRSYKKVRMERHEFKRDLEGMLRMNSELNNEVASLRDDLGQAQWIVNDRRYRNRELKGYLKKKEEEYRAEQFYLDRNVTDLEYENGLLKAKYEKLCNHVLMKEAEFKKIVSEAQEKRKVASKGGRPSTKK